MFEPKREEVAGDWRQLHKEQLCVSYCSPNDIKVLTIYCNNCGIIAQQIIQLHSNTANMCRPSSGRYSTKKTQHWLTMSRMCNCIQQQMLKLYKND
jgi:hypothetical protein